MKALATYTDEVVRMLYVVCASCVVCLVRLVCTRGEGKL